MAQIKSPKEKIKATLDHFAQFFCLFFLQPRWNCQLMQLATSWQAGSSA